MSILLPVWTRPRCDRLPTYNLPADSKTHACSGIVSSVQAFENAKYLFRVLRLYADAIVFHRKNPFPGRASAAILMHNWTSRATWK